jgi:hypothetical protein
MGAMVVMAMLSGATASKDSGQWSVVRKEKTKAGGQ